MPASRKSAARLPVRTVYLFTDLEGCAGVDDWDPRHHDYVNTARYVYERAEMQRLLTGEVNACIEGCVDAGVETVIVNDAHGAGRTILIEELHPSAQMIKGRQRPGWTFALDRCDAIFHIGMHARSDTPGGTLCHTMSRNVKDYRVNGRAASEFDLSILLAGHFGLPAPFFSGEVRACRQAHEIVPNIVTVETKEGMSVECALHLAPVEARRRIRAGAAEAIERANAGEFEPAVWKAPYRVEVEMRGETYKLEQAGAGMEWVNPRTMAWHARDIASAFDFAVYGKAPDKKAALSPAQWRAAHKKR